MPDLSNRLRDSAVAVPVALMSSVALAIVWHLGGWVPIPMEGEYQLSEYFMMVSWRYAAGYAALAFLLGYALKRNRSVATGMVLLFPIVTAIEVVRFPTSHNLLPFEIILYWLPAFGIAFLSASLGRALALASAQSARGPDRPPV